MKLVGTIEQRAATGFDRCTLRPVPVVFRQLAGEWPAVRKWSPEYLGRSFPQLTLTLHENDPAEGTFLDRTLRARVRSLTLEQYAREVPTLDPRWSLREDGGILRHNPGLLDDLNALQPLVRCEPAGSMQYLALWFSPQRQVTGLHADLADIFLIQVYGRKSVYVSDPRFGECLYPETLEKFGGSNQGSLNPDELLVLRNEVRWAAYDFFAPDVVKYPLARDAEFAQAELAPGDVLFLPSGWWHAIRSETVSISVSVERAWGE